MTNRRAGLRLLLQGIAFFDPIGGETCGKNKHASFLKSHFVESGESRPNVGTLFERAAAAVNDQLFSKFNARALELHGRSAQRFRDVPVGDEALEVHRV